VIGRNGPHLGDGLGGKWWQFIRITGCLRRRFVAQGADGGSAQAAEPSVHHSVRLIRSLPQRIPPRLGLDIRARSNFYCLFVRHAAFSPLRHCAAASCKIPHETGCPAGYGSRYADTARETGTATWRACDLISKGGSHRAEISSTVDRAMPQMAAISVAV
jgi:hypothetical protein